MHLQQHGDKSDTSFGTVSIDRHAWHAFIDLHLWKLTRRITIFVSTADTVQTLTSHTNGSVLSIEYNLMNLPDMR